MLDKRKRRAKSRARKAAQQAREATVQGNKVLAQAKEKLSSHLIYQAGRYEALKETTERRPEPVISANAIVQARKQLNK